jgi:hypothetical protein
MMRPRSKFALILVVLFLVAGGLMFLNRPVPYDRHFETQVDQPAYSKDGPLVLYDQAHQNVHKANGAYKPLVDLMSHDGYQVRVLEQTLSASSLTGANVLVSVTPQGSNDTNDAPAFSEAEILALDDWVRAGGSLLLITDHWPFGPAVVSLVQRFGVQVGTGLVEDPNNHHPERGPSHLIFADENGLLKDHPVVLGRNESERVHRVLTFTGTSLVSPSEAVPFLSLSATAIEYPPTPASVDKSGGNTRVTMNYGDPTPARGNSQGLAMQWGKGRIVMLAEAGMLRAERGKHGMLVGLNVPGYDNRQLALNIMHWLSRII